MTFPDYYLSERKCPELDIPHSVITPHGHNRAGSYTTVTCHQGFSFPDGFNQHTLYCQESGEWHDDDMGTCQRKSVISLPRIQIQKYGFF